MFEGSRYFQENETKSGNCIINTDIKGIKFKNSINKK